MEQDEARAESERRMKRAAQPAAENQPQAAPPGASEIHPSRSADRPHPWTIALSIAAIKLAVSLSLLVKLSRKRVG